jgi:hypothetical protein
MLLQGLVDKPIAPTDALKEETLGAVVEKAGIVPGNVVSFPQDQS